VNQPLPIARVVDEVVRAVLETPVVDMHTHIYSTAFGTPVANAAGPADPGGLLLWGIDEMLTYHYLVAEAFRVRPADEMPYETFWRLPKLEQADHVWRCLFVERTPVSEAAKGLLTTLQALGLELPVSGLSGLRRWFAEQDPDEYIDRVMEVANIDKMTMTNAVFDDAERARWDAGITPDSRFDAVLRIDPVLRDWPVAAAAMRGMGYSVADDLSGNSVSEGRRFLLDWAGRMKAVYLAASLPPSFEFTDGGPVRPLGEQAFANIVLPACCDLGVPFAMMIGARRAANPALGDAGDMTGRADIEAVTNICAAFPGNRFLVTMLSRENQHELCVAARKFGNLMIFGCWWFLNNPSLVEEITRMRVELLGTTFIPQHADARVLDQMIYKWHHSRPIIARVLAAKYVDLAGTCWPVTLDAIKRDVRLLLRDNYLNFIVPR
jgi:hypothetical protein